MQISKSKPKKISILCTFKALHRVLAAQGIRTHVLQDLYTLINPVTADVINTANNSLGRLCKMHNPFFYEFQIPSSSICYIQARLLYYNIHTT